MDNGMMISVGQQALIHSLATELHAVNGLDDQVLERIERRAIQQIKGAIFEGAPPPEDEQIRLLDISLDALRSLMAYIKENRDRGNLIP